jgi:hypothetical protein
MYWALALGEERHRAQPPKPNVKKERDMTIYPVEFQRRLEQKWARRIDEIIAVTGNATPPRDPNADDDYEDDREDEEDEESDDEPPLVREPEPDE